MQRPPPVITTLRLRTRYALAGLLMLALWAASAVSMFRDAIALNILLGCAATVTILPLGVMALVGGIQGSDAGMRRAHIALFAGGGVLALVAILEILRRMFFVSGS